MKFSVALEAKMRHGILHEALVQRGWNQRQAAEFLGVEQGKFGRWINLKEVPRDISAELEIKLFELTGKMPEEIWPDEVFTDEFLAQPKRAEIIRDVPADRLLAQSAGIFALPAPPDVARGTQELKEALDDALWKLTPREERIIRALFEDDATLVEIGSREGLDVDQVACLKHKALRKLRSPETARILRTFLM